MAIAHQKLYPSLLQHKQASEKGIVIESAFLVPAITIPTGSQPDELEGRPFNSGDTD